MSISMLDILLVVIILFAAIMGFRKGFMKSLLSLGSSILSLLLAVWLYSPIASFLKTTFLNKELTGLIMQFVKPQLAGLNQSTLSVKEGYEQLGIPSMFYNWFTDGVSSPKVEESINAISKSISQGISGIILDLFAIVLLFVFIKILLLIIKGLIVAISRLPLIKQVDKSAGLILGTVNGFFISYLLMAILFFGVSFSNPEQDYIKWVKSDLKKSYIAKNMYKGNFIVNVLINRNVSDKGEK